MFKIEHATFELLNFEKGDNLTLSESGNIFDNLTFMDFEMLKLRDTYLIDY